MLQVAVASGVHMACGAAHCTGCARCLCVHVPYGGAAPAAAPRGCMQPGSAALNRWLISMFCDIPSWRWLAVTCLALLGQLAETAGWLAASCTAAGKERLMYHPTTGARMVLPAWPQPRSAGRCGLRSPCSLVCPSHCPAPVLPRRALWPCGMPLYWYTRMQAGLCRLLTAMQIHPLLLLCCCHRLRRRHCATHGDAWQAWAHTVVFSGRLYHATCCSPRLMWAYIACMSCACGPAGSSRPHTPSPPGCILHTPPICWGGQGNIKVAFVCRCGGFGRSYSRGSSRAHEDVSRACASAG